MEIAHQVQPIERVWDYIQQIFLIIFSHPFLFLPILLIFAVFWCDFGKGVGLRYFLADMPRKQEYDGNPFKWVLATLFQSTTFGTFFYLTIYIGLAWLIAVHLDIGERGKFHESHGVHKVIRTNLILSASFGTLLIAGLIFIRYLKIKRQLVIDIAPNYSLFWELVRCILGMGAGLAFSFTIHILEIVKRPMQFFENAFFDYGYFSQGFLQSYAPDPRSWGHFFLDLGLDALGILFAGFVIYLGVYTLFLVVIVALNKTRPIAVPYLFVVFGVIMALYTLFRVTPEYYDLFLLVGFLIYLALVWQYRIIKTNRMMRFDGINARLLPDGQNPQDDPSLPKHDVYELDERQKHQLEANAGIPNSELIDPVAQLDAWAIAARKSQNCGPDEKPKMLLMGTSGGAILAAYWTTLIADGLASNSKLNGAIQSIRLITGASGGMVGAGYVAGMAPDLKSKKPSTNDSLITDQMDNDSLIAFSDWQVGKPIKRDFLTQVFSQLVSYDLMALLFPRVPKMGNDDDRGKTLQRQFHTFGAPTKNAPTFRDFYDAEESGNRPSLLYSPMMLESGAPLLISNLDLTEIIDVEKGSTKDSVSMFNLYKGSEHSFTVATAARMSATFPYVSPAVNLPTTKERPRRVVDAGYYENYGINLLCKFLMNEKIKNWIEENTSGVAVIQVQAFPQAQEKETSWVNRVFHFFTSPIEGVLAARSSSMLLRNKQFLRVVQRAYEGAYSNQTPKSEKAMYSAAEDRTKQTDENNGFVRSFTFVNRRHGLPLNWYLPEEAYESLYDQVFCRPQDFADKRGEYDLNSSEKLAAEVINELGNSWKDVW